jgi:NSS family neurotransmitter:Na+ symporter
VFVLAATGSAIGLGNIWRFPYVAGENGGGAFVLVYLAFVASVGVPIMIAEVMLGRRGRRSPVNAILALAREEGLNPAWWWLGGLTVLAGFLVLSFYSVVAGWTFAYVIETASGTFEGATLEAVKREWNAIVSSPAAMLLWHTIFMTMTIVVVSRGVRDGLERAVRWLMPALFVLLLVLVGYAMGNGLFEEAVLYLFRPNFADLTALGVLTALGQAFFTLSLATGALMIYGSYLPASASIPRSALIVACADTAVALLAGLAIFPLVFAYGLEPQQRESLAFNTLTIAFGHMPGGQFFGTLFFVLLGVAAWTSAISMLEPATAWIIEHHHVSRSRAALAAGAAAWLLGIGSALSFNAWSGYRLWDKTFFGIVEFISTNIMLPLGGLLIAVFAGWRMSRRSSADELDIGDGALYGLWRLLVRIVAPVAVLLIFMDVLGVVPLTL